MGQRRALVRDPSVPRARRVAAWRRCLRRYAPYGFDATLRHLHDRFGSLDDPAALIDALSALERSRAVWLAEVDEFRQHRRAAKARGRRRPTAADLDRYRQQGWPGGTMAGGPVSGSLADRPVAAEFLARHGMTPWIPAPVNHRRRVRRLPQVETMREEIIPLLGCSGFPLVLIALVVGALADVPAIAWWTFGTVAPVVLVFLCWRAAVENAARRREIVAERARVTALADAAEERWRADRSRSFNLRPDR
ncbi:hypothetical protein [Micromonospora sp. NPDC005806]|uniref:hypothetical protein n=1 Tax=Micromonospora sp. NPDC005806 TaxID=3364234 RepID=UPI0036769D95